MTKDSASTENSCKQYIEQPRMRMMKPQLMKHELMSELELKTQLPFKQAFMGIFFFCNRSGCFRWEPIRLRAEIFPHLSIDFKTILDTFEEVGMIRKYSHKGQFYGCIPTWAKHQRIPESEPETDIPCLDPRTGEIFFESERPRKSQKTTEPPSPASSEELASEPLPMEGVLLPADLEDSYEDAVRSPSPIMCHGPESNGAQGALVVLKSALLGKEGKGKGMGRKGKRKRKWKWKGKRK